MKNICFALLGFATFLALALPGSAESPLQFARAAEPATPPAPGTGKGSKEQYLTDINNHLKKLNEATKGKNAAQVKESAGFLREDVKALVKETTGLEAKDQKRLTVLQADVVSLTGKLERNAAKGDWADTREFHAKLKKSVDGIQAVVTGTPAKKTS